ncbi:hypothetical protein AB4Z54_69890, partial [Streptomyces sp. MCAF7]
MIDEVWGAVAPQTAVNTIQVYASRRPPPASSGQCGFRRALPVRSSGVYAAIACCGLTCIGSTYQRVLSVVTATRRIHAVQSPSGEVD